MNQDFVFYETPIGTVKIEGNQQGIASIIFLEDKMEPSSNIPETLKKCVVQLDEYFNKERKEFNLNLNPLTIVISICHLNNSKKISFFICFQE